MLPRFVQATSSYTSVDPNVIPRLLPSFVQISSDPSVDPSVVPRLIPNYVTDLEPSQDTTFPNNDGIYTNNIFFPDIQRDPIVSSVGPRVVPSIFVLNDAP